MNTFKLNSVLDLDVRNALTPVLGWYDRWFTADHIQNFFANSKCSDHSWVKTLNCHYCEHSKNQGLVASDNIADACISIIARIGYFVLNKEVPNGPREAGEANHDQHERATHQPHFNSWTSSLHVGLFSYCPVLCQQLLFATERNDKFQRAQKLLSKASKPVIHAELYHDWSNNPSLEVLYYHSGKGKVYADAQTVPWASCNSNSEATDSCTDCTDKLACFLATSFLNVSEVFGHFRGERFYLLIFEVGNLLLHQTCQVACTQLKGKLCGWHLHQSVA